MINHTHYYSLLDEMFDILKSEVNQEHMTFVLGKVMEHRTAKAFNAAVTNATGSDAIVTEQKVFSTALHKITMDVNDRLEVKSTAKVFASQKRVMRVCGLLSKRGGCEFIIIQDARPEYNRTFCIPHDVFFERARIDDLNHAKSFKWNEDYIPALKHAENTKLLLEYEVTNA